MSTNNMQSTDKFVRPDIKETERIALVDEFLSRGVEAVYPTPEALRAELLSGKRLTAYMGIDPTAPELHVGHMSQMRKMERLQNLGHHVVLLIGDFTARIGDPSDKSASRVRLTSAEVAHNAATYIDQAGKILDFSPDSPNPIDVRYNSEWLSKLNFEDVLELAANFTVQQMLERSMFQKRLAANKPINLIEFLYPLMQGYDSVALETDIELGGRDQIFNMLMGRELAGRAGKEKYVVAGELLVDPSGKKIGKTEGNMVTLIDDPETMYHKIMLWGDAIAPHALELCSTIPMEEVRAIQTRMESGELSGFDAKKLLAQTIVGELYSPEQAKQAGESFDNVLKQTITSEMAPVFEFDKGLGLLDILVQSGLAKSKGDARRLISQNGVSIDGEVIPSDYDINAFSGGLIQVGKRNVRHVMPKA